MAEIAGLKLIVPSSVAGSGVSVSASGKVTFTSAPTISVNGVFSATHDNYLVVARHLYAGTSANFSCRMRLSGSDNSTASSYVFQDLDARSTTVSGARATQAQGKVGALSNTQRSGTHIYFYGPALAQPTAFRAVTVSGIDSASLIDNAVTHNQSTAYDGFTLFDGDGNGITGALCVYGLSQ